MVSRDILAIDTLPALGRWVFMGYPFALGEWVHCNWIFIYMSVLVCGCTCRNGSSFIP